MSYLETGKDRFRWVTPVVRTSIRGELGCVQCGSRLDQPEHGKFNFSGKCLNCIGFMSDDGEHTFEELED